jgi:phosphoribosylamine---glycine ligase
LHAGKGVVVADSEAELLAAINTLGAGEPLVLEEALEGPEASLLVFSDGETVVPMPPAQDHKRLRDGDQGPNTGGMGAYAPVPGVPDTATLVRQVVAPVIAALAARGTPFVGVLFVNLMLTSDGPRVLEYNARWGDPEAQALLPLLDGDLLTIMDACVRGRLDPKQVGWHPGAALGVVLAAANYPVTPRAGDAIMLPPTEDDVQVFYAGTTLDGATLRTAGGRVLTIVGTGADVAEARERAYRYADRVHFDGMQLRRDIGHYALEHRDR